MARPLRPRARALRRAQELTVSRSQPGRFPPSASTDLPGCSAESGPLPGPLRALPQEAYAGVLARLRRELPELSLAPSAPAHDTLLRRRVEAFVFTEFVRRASHGLAFDEAVRQLQEWHRHTPLLARFGAQQPAVVTQAWPQLAEARLQRLAGRLLQAAVDRCEVPRQARYGIVMAGGLGSRFWPMGRHHVPKPSVRLFAEGTMLQLTLRRLLAPRGPGHLIIVANARHLTFIARDLREDPQLAQARDRILLVGEPLPGGTATALLLGLAHALRHRAQTLGQSVRQPEEFDRLAEALQIEVFTADHMVDGGFQDDLWRMAQRAWMGPYLSLQGYRPDHENDQFGQQVLGERVVPGLPELANLRAFGEKDPALARRWAERPTPILWNSGYMAARGDTMLAMLRDLAGPDAFRNGRLSARLVQGRVVDHLTGFRRMQAALLQPEGPARRALLLETYTARVKDAQAWDVAFAEPLADGASERAGVLTTAMSYAWFDIGMPDQIAKYAEGRPGGAVKDRAGNFTAGPVVDPRGGSSGNVALGLPGATVRFFGVRDLLAAVETDALLVQARGQSGGVRTLSLAGAAHPAYQGYFLSTIRYPLSNAARPHATTAGPQDGAEAVTFIGPGMNVWTAPGRAKPLVTAVAEAGFIGTVGLDAVYGAGRRLVIVRERNDIYVYGPEHAANGLRHAARLQRRMRHRDQAVAAFLAQPCPVPVRGTLHQYAWGGRFLRRLLRAGPKDAPLAEYCLGGHPKAPSSVRLGNADVTLDRLAAEAGGRLFKPAAAAGREEPFPWVLKILDARRMLSLQVHPRAARARQKFLEGDVNYADPHHKWEIHVALSDFWMVHGFRPLGDIRRVLRQVPELGALWPETALRSSQALREFLMRLLSLSPKSSAGVLGPLAARLAASARVTPLQKTDHAYWVLRAVQEFGTGDPAILALPLLNLVRLRPGEGTWQPAGTLHAYLEGTTVELTGCSDNVLRAGLTRKPVDVPELLAVLEDAGGFRGGRTPRVRGTRRSATERVYVVPGEPFELSRLEIPRGAVHAAAGRHGAQMLLALSSGAQIRAASGSVRLPQGQGMLIPAGTSYQIASASGATLYRASQRTGARLT